MARPQSPDYADRRQEIIARATELFARQGFHKTSIADIAAACRMSKSLLYHYFASKTDILFSAMDDHTRLLTDIARTIAASPAPPDEKLRALTREFMRVYVAATAKHIVMLNELEALAPADRARIIAQEDEVVRLISSLIGDILGPERARGQDLTVLSMLFMGMINWTYTWFKPGGAMTSDQLAEQAASLFITGLEGAVPAAPSGGRSSVVSEASRG